jgi:hypothetical protein
MRPQESCVWPGVWVLLVGHQQVEDLPLIVLCKRRHVAGCCHHGTLPGTMLGAVPPLQYVGVAWRWLPCAVLCVPVCVSLCCRRGLC